MHAVITLPGQGVIIAIHLSSDEQVALDQRPQRNFAAELQHVVQSDKNWAVNTVYSFYFTRRTQRALQLDTPETVKTWALTAAEKVFTSYI